MSFETPPPISEQKREPAKFKKLFAHCFEISRFEEGDRIPVGGESIFSDETDIGVNGDFESFKEFYGQTRDLAHKYDLEKLKDWLSSNGIDVNPKLFAVLYAFTQQYEKKYPRDPKGSIRRNELYANKGAGLKLSDVFAANSAECAEIAALAQGYLQTFNLPATYFSGDALWDRDNEYSEEHSFIVIRLDGETLIYDPTNPTETNAGKFPSIYALNADFDAEMAKNQKRFVTARNLLSKKEAFFGVNNGTNVIPEKHIV